MMIALSILMLGIGLIVIVKSADWFVGAAVTIAQALRLPPMIIGATIVSIGTTLPELITSITAVAMGTIKGDVAGYNALAIGNSLGSMACNLGLILAISLLAKSGMADKSFAAKGTFLLITSALLSIFVASKQTLELYEGIILLILFATFIALNVWQALRHRKVCDSIPTNAATPLLPFSGKLDCKVMHDNHGDSKACTTRVALDTGGYADAGHCKKHKTIGLLLALKFIVGSCGIAIGAFVMVSNAQSLCSLAGIPAQIVGATVLAIGTSLPELATAISAISKGEGALSMGNLIGANVINATLLLGTVTLMSGALQVDYYTAVYGVIFMMIISAIAIIPTAIRGKTSRLQGGCLLLTYAAMVIWNVIYIIK